MCLTAGHFPATFGSISDTSLKVSCETPVILANTHVQRTQCQVGHYEKIIKKNPTTLKREETALMRDTGSYCKHLIYPVHGVFLPTEEQRLSLSNTVPAGPKLMQYFLATLL